jgi:hypothetical protein
MLYSRWISYKKTLAIALSGVGREWKGRGDGNDVNNV